MSSLGARWLTVIVRPHEREGFELIAGERRWRASRLAGMQTIPCLVDDAADDAVPLEPALIENIARADLTVIEEARTIASLLDDLNISGTDLARRLGRTRSDLAHTVRLLELPDQAIDLIDSGQLTKGHGKALLTEPDHDRRRQLARRATERRVVRPQPRSRDRPRRGVPPDASGPAPRPLAAAATLEETISKALGIGIQACPHRHGYQLLSAQAAGDRLVQLLGLELPVDGHAT